MMSLIDTAVEKAIEVLRACAHARGFKAAVRYYDQVWARDGVITLLGAMATDDTELHECARRTLESLAEFQCAEMGRIPNYIPLGTGEVQLPINEAYDSNLWYVIGHGAYYAKTGDIEFAEHSRESLVASMRWARFMDSNDDGLMECPPCCDWKDTWDNSYHNLNVNVLHAEALRCMGEMDEALGREPDMWRKQRRLVIDRINANFWVGHEEEREREYAAHHRPGHLRNNYDINRAVNWISDFYFPHLPMKDPAPRRLDTMGNVGAILFGVADEVQSARILDYIHERGVAEPYPIRVTYPIVRPGDPVYHGYYQNRGYCAEDTGHNGGIWAFVGGFYVAALASVGRLEEARHQLENLAALNRLPASRTDNPEYLEEWGFCEHHHGVTGRGIGAQGQAWSAGMYLYARRAVEEAFRGEQSGQNE